MKLKDTHLTQDDANSRVAAYESFLDLFTLLSFILITSAFVLVNRSESMATETYIGDPKNNSANEVWSSVVSKTTARGTGTPTAPLQEHLYIVLYRSERDNMVATIDGTASSKTQLKITPDSVSEIMTGIEDKLSRAKTIYLVVYQSKEKIDPGIFLEISQWLAAHNYGNYRVSFFDEDAK